MLATDKQPYRLKSYAYGQWMLGEGEGKALADAATGRSVALIDSSGIEFAAMLDYARNQGGPALRSMSFHHRALMLKALGQALMAEKEAFYALSTALLRLQRAPGVAQYTGASGRCLRTSVT